MSDSYSLKQRIRRGEIVRNLGVDMAIDQSRLEEHLSRGQYDYLSVDSQHSAYSEDRLVSFCAMARALDLPVQFRIKHTRQAFLIGNYLDLGPAAIMVPQVEDEATVDEAVAAFYYPQTGLRSWGGEARWGLEDPEDRLGYAAWWNSHGVLVLQLESVGAVTQARQLAKSGVDLLTFGANDLNFSLEAHPQYPFATVDECIRHVCDQVADTDVQVGMGSTSPEETDKYLEMGVTVLGQQVAS